MLKDKIGREDIIEKIYGIIENLEEGNHICLSIDGAWGSGKTFLINLIEERLLKDESYWVIKYDAWENSFYSDPLIAILSCICESLNDRQSKLKKLGDQTKKFTKAIGKAVMDNSSASSLAIISEIMKNLEGQKSSFHNVEGMESYKSYNCFLREIKDELNKIATGNRGNEKGVKLVILVDEIDRCLPQDQLIILERLHHLFDTENCVVVVAINQDCICQTIHQVYGMDGTEYLRKFFDLNFKLDLSSVKYWESLMNDYVDTITKFVSSETQVEEIKVAVKFAKKCLEYDNNKVFSNIDNRRIYRYYESLKHISTHFGWGNLNAGYIFFIIIALFIRKNISTEFLSESNIIENQKEVTKNQYHEIVGKHDYIQEHLDIYDLNEVCDLRDPKELYHLNTFVKYFNDIIFFSIGYRRVENEMRAFMSQNTIDYKICQELCDLIRVYGGDK